MKAILVIDMPNDCTYECPLYNEEYDSCGYYKAKAIYKECPLKPMPNKHEHKKGLCSDFVLGFEDGWNECLEELEK